MDSSWICAPAEAFLHGCLEVQAHSDGWVCPQRFLPEQRAVLESCLAWHPGLYKQMAACTSGVTLEFITDASLVAIDLRFGEEPAGTIRSRELVQSHDEQRKQQVLDGASSTSDASNVSSTSNASNTNNADAVGTQVFDGVSYEVNGKHKGMLFASLQDKQTTQVHIALPTSSVSEPALFELRKPVRVKVFLPALRSCEVRTIACNGTQLEPLAKKEQLLVLGDSITQGFVCGDPAYAWAHQVAQKTKLDLLNQGIGGQVFLPESFQGFSAHPKFVPQVIVVALGVNYRYEACVASHVYADIRRFFATLHTLWPCVPTYVLTPLWHQDGPYLTHPKSCFGQVSEFIQQAAAAYSNMVMVDGAHVLDEDERLLADGFEHPNKAGHTQIAQNLSAYLCSREHSSKGQEGQTLSTPAVGHAPVAMKPIAASDASAVTKHVSRQAIAQPPADVEQMGFEF